MSLRKPRILWASIFSLLDTSSGAAISVREMLKQLKGRGYEIEILGATVFDNERGVTRISDDWGQIQQKAGSWVAIVDDVLTHKLFVTKNTARSQVFAFEEAQWHTAYLLALEAFKPDLVYFYGGFPMDMLVADEARSRGIPVVAYLANGSYSGTRWCRDVDLLLTNSNATAQFYREKHGYDVIPVGTFIDRQSIVADAHTREMILSINPTLEKGGAIVALLAIYLEERRPDLRFQIVESRGSFSEIVRLVSTAMGKRQELSNVVIMQNMLDMRPVYASARIMLSFSLWWEAFNRSLLEAMMNGIPCFISDRGGMREVAQDPALIVKFDSEFYEPPYTKIPAMDHLQPIADRIVKLFDDDPLYRHLSARAVEVAHSTYSIQDNTDRLINALDRLLQKKARITPHRGKKLSTVRIRSN